MEVMIMAFLEAEHLCKRYIIRGSQGKEYIQALDDVNFTLERGKVLGIIGESGCGKSTLGRILTGLEEITSGTVRYEGNSAADMIKKNRRQFCKLAQMVFQNPFDTFPPGQTIETVLMRVLRIHHIGSGKNERLEICVKALEEAGLRPAKDFLNRYPHELSGGQLQRISIVRSMLLNPSFIVADEPVSMLDVSVRADIINILRDISKTKNTSLVFISHDLATTRYITDTIAVMYLGQIVEYGETDQVLQNPCHPYTQALLSYCADIDPDEQKIPVSVPGEPPVMSGERKGCYFAPRCSRACAKCFAERPTELICEPGHTASCHMPGKTAGE